MIENGRSGGAITFVLSTMLIDAIGIGVIVPVLPDLIVELTGETLGQAARYNGWLMLLYASIQFVAAPILGNLSDRFGRRPVLLASLLAFAIDYLMMGLAPTLAWLFVGRALAGVAGATYPTVNAYIADVTDDEERAQYFGYIAAAWSIGFMLGPALGGLLGEYGARVPFFGAAGLAMLNLSLGLVALPESLSQASRRTFSLRRANPVGALLGLRRLPLVIAVMPVIVLYQLVHDANPSTWTYVTIEKFAWSPAEIGYSISAVAVLMTLVQMFGIRYAIQTFGDFGAVLCGWLALTIGYVGFAFATEDWVMYASMLPFALGGVAMPAMRGILSQQVEPDRQGELAGAIASVMSLTTIASPIMMTELFRAFSAENASIYFPGAPFFAASVLSLAAAAIFWSVTSPQRSRWAETS